MSEFDTTLAGTYSLQIVGIDCVDNTTTPTASTGTYYINKCITYIENMTKTLSSKW